MIPKFENFSATCAPLLMDNLDTDQIFPARYLIATDKKGFGENLFRDLRFADDGVTSKADFVLNKPQYKKAEILLAHENFGSGSSREHAPWALLAYGFKAVMGISFADTFKNNSLKNGLLIMELPREVIDAMHTEVEINPDEKAKIDLENQTITWKGIAYTFPINAFIKKCLLEGLDDIGYTLSFTKDIEAYEKLQAVSKIKK
jgi:3-isopropylmalate/(R)-2-methylmalate dehydratase small subunit